MDSCSSEVVKWSGEGNQQTRMEWRGDGVEGVDGGGGGVDK